MIKDQNRRKEELENIIFHIIFSAFEIFLCIGVCVVCVVGR